LTSDLDDHRLRLAAVEHVKRLGTGGAFTSDQLYPGLVVDGQRIALTNQRGTFKPAAMRHLLRICLLPVILDSAAWPQVHRHRGRQHALLQ
jgi:hypothetical protein